MIKSGITLSIVTRQRDDHTETKLKRFDIKNKKMLRGVILPPPVGFPLKLKNHKSCNPGNLQHSVIFYWIHLYQILYP